VNLRNMKIRLTAFNSILLAVFFLGLTGCQTDKEREKKKEVTVMRFHIESNAYAPNHTAIVSIGRNALFNVTIDNDWFLNEGDILRATLVDNAGDWAIMIEFDSHGTLLFDSVTGRFRGQRLAIYADFGPKRWIAAPVINYKNSSGKFIFTPDATREEAERIVNGLNNVSKEVHKDELKAMGGGK
jgi:preprotein translocase subunit SecD